MTNRLFILLCCLFALLPWGTTPQCGPGTLRCLDPSAPENSKALICDPSLDYVLFENSCIKQVIPNCLITLNENECKVCRFGNFSGRFGYFALGSFHFGFLDLYFLTLSNRKPTT